MAEELDYPLEAASQETFAEAYDGDAEIRIPHVVAAHEQVLVTEWIDGIPLSKIIREGTPEQRDRARCCWPGSCSRARCWRGCCTPTRTPATSAPV